ncbi:uncharacterized protein RHIMIDRAFT_297409 [Rhizopus microsporus ATCC 52813]|uniref:Uncharacterized protein n=1 Tax=Rhizopus microsporus ATCC 52813 TaxID=1340429 RepID=A0A2G4SRZ8_RHIZD|nr:uncharacterized protein RHIMIDRAFT_297409 [Rhizopus microsporus ATCC 52813]PHZ11543.1 hypothetical protein RHIMIDRAFT_297409 [Rhizopus microsporus ATCC 52813]
MVEIVGLISAETTLHSSDRNAMKISRYEDEQPDNVNAEFQHAHAELATLRNQRVQAPSQSTVDSSDDDSPTLPAATQSPFSWRDTNHLNLIKQWTLENDNSVVSKDKRLLLVFSNLPPITMIFNISIYPPKLECLRILGIYYPTRNVVALLVHNDYTPELKAHLRKFKVHTKEDFNPSGGSTLMDPHYAQNTKEERDSYAVMHHRGRLKRALTYIRAPVKYAMARYFYSQGWINKEALNDTLASKESKSTEVLYLDHDIETSKQGLENNSSHLL